MDLKNKLYLNKGLYDNRNIYENTIESIKDTIMLNMGLYLTIRQTKDRVLIVYEDSDLSRLHNIKDKISDCTYEELLYLSMYHIPTLEEVLKLINGKVDLILNLKTTMKPKEIFNLLDNYNGKYILVSKHARILMYLNKHRENYFVGELITKGLKFSLIDLLIHTDFKSYDIDYFDKIKYNKIKESGIVVGYLINNQEKLDEYKDMFDFLIIDNYQKLNLK